MRAILIRTRGCFIYTLFLSLIIGRVEHLFTCPTATCLPSWKKYPCKSLPQILFSWVVCVFDSTSCLQILEMNNLIIPWFADCFFFFLRAVFFFHWEVPLLCRCFKRLIRSCILMFTVFFILLMSNPKRTWCGWCQILLVFSTGISRCLPYIYICMVLGVYLGVWC